MKIDPARGWAVEPVFSGDHRLVAMLESMHGNVQSPGESDVGTRNLLYTLVLNLRPRMVLEIGCHIGTAAVVIGTALRRNGYGSLVSLEPAARYESLAKKHIAEMELEEIVTVFPLFSTQSECATLLKSKGPFDLIYIDARHDYADALFDITLSVSNLSENGLVVLHDTGEMSEELDATKRGGVRKALADFASSNPRMRVLFFEYPLWPNRCGAAILCNQASAL